jgi:hypothetical protein
MFIPVCRFINGEVAVKLGKVKVTARSKRRVDFAGSDAAYVIVLGVALSWPVFRK